MKDFSILPKEFSQESQRKKRHLRFSLALRVFLASLLFMVVPLLFHSFINYGHRYREQVKDVLIAFDLMGRGREHFILRIVDLQKEILEFVAATLPWGEGKERLVQKWKEEWPVGKTMPTEIFYLAADDKDWICLFSSEATMEGRYFSNNDALRKAFLEPSSVFFKEQLEGKEYLLFVTKTIVVEGKAKGLLIATLPASLFIESLQEPPPSFYRLDISFIDEKGTILISSSPILEGKTLQKDAFLQEVKGAPNGFLLTTKDGNFLAGRRKLVSPAGALLGSMDARFFSDLHKKRYWSEVTLLLFSFFIIGGGISLFIVWRISHPLRALYTTMEEVRGGNMEARFHPDRLGFEINLLGKSFNEMIDSVVLNQKLAETEKLQKEILQNELKIGREIQENLIVSRLPLMEGLDIATSYLPAKEVGGDFYDLFSHQDLIDLLIADTSGKGISACFYSLTVRSMIRAFAQGSADLSEILTKTNQLFCLDSQDSGIFVTLWMGLYDQKKKILHYASAGHYPAFLKKKNHQFLELHTPSTALGVEKSSRYPVQSIAVERGDLLFLYTDGVLDAMNREKESFGRKRLKNFLIFNDKKTAEEWASSLMEEVTDFTKGTPQYDDITFMIIRMH